MPVIVFDSASQALLAESLLEEADFEIDMVPPPADLVEGCALAIQFRAADRRDIEKLLAQRRVVFRGIY